ncbi:MAG: hypothetical protein M3O03_05170, partial [Pseudomonadota bacterium]|nr:hypothetical protein [Pseudomonadota bacterium]
MRSLFSLIVIIYLIGIGVMLAPTFRTSWTTVPASQLTASVVQELPGALAWPAAVYHRLADTPTPAVA